MFARFLLASSHLHCGHLSTVCRQTHCSISENIHRVIATTSVNQSFSTRIKTSQHFIKLHPTFPVCKVCK